MTRAVTAPATLAAAVASTARLLGQYAGRCAVCGRPVLLMVWSGLVPPHPGRGQGGWCAGGEQQPAGSDGEG